MNYHRLLIPLCCLLLSAAHAATGGPTMTNTYAFTLKSIEGKDVNLGAYRGQVLLLVNVASRCGFTKQYAGLQQLHTNLQARGFAVLGFPANDFLRQEPGTEAEIRTFCTQTYGVTFPMFAKITVKGDGQHPLYAWLTDPVANPGFGGPITWNFNKFLIGRDGRVLARFGSKTTPQDAELLSAIEKALAVPAPNVPADAAVTRE